MLNLTHKTLSYSRDIGPRILEFFESFYNIDYPLPKQDMAAIPDFAAGPSNYFREIPSISNSFFKLQELWKIGV